MRRLEAHLCSSIHTTRERHESNRSLPALCAGLLLCTLGFPASLLGLPESVETRSVRVMNYKGLTSPLTVVFRYTTLVPGAAGQAEIDPSRFGLKIHGSFSKLPPASRLGLEYLTYVLWAVTPEGRAVNLGEISLAGDEGRISAKMVPSRFGLIVTAESYFAVSRPSNAVAFEADLPPGAKASVLVSQASCELLTSPVGAQLTDSSSRAVSDPAAPLVIEEARRAIGAARRSGAE